MSDIPIILVFSEIRFIWKFWHCVRIFLSEGWLGKTKSRCTHRTLSDTIHYRDWLMNDHSYEIAYRLSISATIDNLGWPWKVNGPTCQTGVPIPSPSCRQNRTSLMTLNNYCWSLQRFFSAVAELLDWMCVVISRRYVIDAASRTKCSRIRWRWRHPTHLS